MTVKRIQVTLDSDQYRILQNLKGFGMKDAEKIRNVIIAYLSEKSYLKAEFSSAETSSKTGSETIRETLHGSSAETSSNTGPETSSKTGPKTIRELMHGKT